MKQRVTLTIALAAGAEPPTEFRIFQAGVVETTKGLFKFNETSCEKVMAAAAAWGNEYPIDYEHASLMAVFSADPAEAGKAAGWFKPEVRGGELWASGVSWTSKAAEKLKAREFRYMSPTFARDDDGTITELINVALTNLPATHNLDPLVASRVEPTPAPSAKETTMKQLLIKLGLAENASEAEAIIALGRVQEMLTSFIALSGKATADEALAVFTGLKAAAAQVTTLTARVAELEKLSTDREVEALIAAGKADGKLTPALEPWARTQSLSALKAFLEVAPKVVETKGKEEPQGGAPLPVALTREEGEVAKLLQLDPKKVAAHKTAKTTAA